MTLAVLAAKASLIVVLAVAAGIWIFRRYRFIRGLTKADKIPKHDRLMLILMLIAGWFIFQHLGSHGYFFTCQYPRCKSTAALPLIVYAAFFGMQPIISRLVRHPYLKRDYQAWLLVGISFFILCCIAGKITGILTMRYRRDLMPQEQLVFGIAKSKKEINSAPRSSPGMSNGYDYIRQAKPFFQDLSKEFHDSPLQYGSRNLSEFKKEWQKADIGRLEKELADMQPAFDALEKAAAADYYYCDENNKENLKLLLQLRSAAHALAMRARLRMHKQQTVGALADMETLLRLAAMLQKDKRAELDGVMIATAIRGTGLNVAAEFFRYYRSDATLLGQLRQTLERNAAIIRVQFPMDSIPLKDHESLPLALDDATDRSATRGALVRYYYKWAQYDCLQIAISLEAYHRDNNRYPEQLEELCPKYMPIIPCEAYYDKAYGYKNMGSDFELSWGNMKTPEY